LNIAAAIETVVEATASGNQDIALNGVDHSGNTLQGSNEHFQISVPIEEIPATRKGLISKLYAAFKSLTDAGDIAFPTLTEDEADKIRRAVGMI
jgi:hypothetical protein